jgi:exopolyphosphatase/guanosine-5'-triphosphate,3'-diphosphate pyrophosphatase
VTSAPVPGSASDGGRASIDCGSNTTRLLLRTASGPDVRRERITGLGRGVQATGRVGADGIERVCDALAEYRAEIEQVGAELVAVVTTAASRDAVNTAEFLDAAEAVLGMRPRVLSGEEEAGLTFRGAVGAVDVDGEVLVLDIGGRSTELARGDRGGGLAGGRSLPVGSVGLTEEYLAHDPPRPEELSALLSVLRLHLDDVALETPELIAPAAVIAVGGTATTVAAVEIGLAEHDPSRVHGFVLRRDAAEDVFRTLATEPLAARVHNPGLPAARADVIVAGCAILVGVMRYLDLDRVVVSEHDLLDGLLDES